MTQPLAQTSVKEGLAHERVDLLGVLVSVVTIPKAVAIIQSWVKHQHKTYICVAPVATLVDCQKDEAYKAVVNRAGMVTPDGMPVVWLAKSKGCSMIERTYGPDLLLALCEAGIPQGLRHFFYGSTCETLNLLQDRLMKRFPELKIVGAIAPAFEPRAGLVAQSVKEQINQASPDIVWVGLGSPKQDFWMSLNRSLLQAPVMIGVGAAFDFLSGVKPQAPRWMQKSGLEWVFRLWHEPRRLWRRYLIGNTAFVGYLIKSIFKRNG